MTENKRYSMKKRGGALFYFKDGVVMSDEDVLFDLNMLNDTNNALKSDRHRFEEENKKLKAKVDDKEVAVEVECEKQMQRVFDLIDEKIKLYSHKPVSAPISQPMSINFDADVDRLARLSELEALKKELKE